MDSIHEEPVTTQEKGLRKTRLTAEEAKTKYASFGSEVIKILSHDMRKDMDEYGKRLPYAMGANALNPMRTLFNVLNALRDKAEQQMSIKIHYVIFDKERYERRTVAIEGDDFEKLVSSTSNLIRLMECGEQVSTAALDLFLEADCFAEVEAVEEYIVKLEAYRDNFKNVADMAYEFAQCFDANN